MGAAVWRTVRQTKKSPPIIKIRKKNPQDGPPPCRPGPPLKIAPSTLAAIIKPMITPKKQPTLRRNPPRRSERRAGGHGSSSGHHGGRGVRGGERGALRWGGRPCAA